MPGPRLRLLRRLALLLGLLVGILLLAWIFRKPLFGGLLARAIESALGQSLGGRWHVADVDGSWWADLDVKGATLEEAPPEGPLASAHVESIRVSYDVIGLLRGAGLAAVEHVRIASADVGLDLDRPTRSAPSARLEVGSPPRGLVLPHLDVTGALSVRAFGRDLRAGRVEATSRGPDAVDLVVRDVQAGGEPIEGSLEGRIDRRPDASLTWTSSTRLAGLSLPRVSWSHDGLLEAEVSSEAGGVVLAASAQGIEARADTLELAALPPWLLDALPTPPGPPTSGKLSVRATLLDLAAGALRFELEVDSLAWPEQAVDRVVARGERRANGTLALALVDVTGRDTVLRIREAMLDPANPWWLRTAAEIELECSDLRSLGIDVPERVGARLEARAPDGETLEISHLAVQAAGIRATGTGQWRTSRTPAAWREETSLDLSLKWFVDDLASRVEGAAGEAEGALRVEGTPRRLRLTLDAQGRDARWHGLAVTSLAGAATWEEDRVWVDPVAVELEGGRLDGRGRVQVDPLVVEEARAEVHLTTLSPLAALLAEPPDTLEGRGTIAIEHTGPPGANIATVALALEDVRVGERVIGALTGRGEVDLDRRRVLLAEAALADPDLGLEGPGELTWSERSVRTEGLRLRRGDDRVDLAAEVDWEARRVMVARLGWEGADTEAALEAPLTIWWDASGEQVRVPALRVRIGEDVHAAAALEVWPGSERALVTDLEVQGTFGRARLNTDLALTWSDGRVAWSGLDASVDPLRVRSEGSVSPEARFATIDALVVESEGRTVRLARPAALRWDDDGAWSENLAFLALGGRIEGRAAWTGRPSADLVFEDLLLSEWRADVPGRARGRLSIEGEAGTLDVHVEGLPGRGPETRARLVVRQGAAGGLVLEQVELHDGELLAVAGRGRLPWRVSPEGLIFLPDERPALALAGHAYLPDDVGGGRLALRIEGDASALRAYVETQDLARTTGRTAGRLDDLALEALLAPDEARLEVRPRPDGPLDFDGAIRVAAGLPWWRPTAEAIEALQDAALAGSLRADVRDLNSLRTLIGNLESLEGGVRATLRARGTLRRPEIDGRLDLDGVSVVPTASFPAITDVVARLVWREGHVDIERLDGRLGYEPFQVTGGARIGGTEPPQVDLVLRGTRLLLARSSAMRLRADLDLTVRGTATAPTIAGRVDIRDLLYVQPVSLAGDAPASRDANVVLFRITDEPLASAKLDVRVVADRTIRVRNNLLRGDASADLVLRGTASLPEPQGRIDARAATVYLPVNTLVVEGAEVVFPPGEPFFPQIRATARSRAAGYELGVRVSGRLPDVELNVFSRPRLSDEDAMLLLATGAAPGGGEGGGIEALSLQAVLTFFGDNLLSFAKGASDPEARPFFDRFTMSVGREQSRRGLDTIEAEVQLAGRVYLRAERDRYDETNLGFLWRMRFR